MNTFTSQKLGEVVAFARIGNDTLKKGKKGFLEILNKKEIGKMEKTFTEIEKKVLDISEKQGVKKEVEKKAKETFKKVTDMRNEYVGGKWNDGSEILEWTGFYTGASLVHWKLISGAAESIKNKQLLAISKKAISFYDAMFVSDEKKLKKIGASQA